MELDLNGWILVEWCMILLRSTIYKLSEYGWAEARMGGFRISAFALLLFTFIITFGDTASTAACLTH